MLREPTYPETDNHRKNSCTPIAKSARKGTSIPDPSELGGWVRAAAQQGLLWCRDAAAAQATARQGGSRQTKCSPLFLFCPPVSWPNLVGKQDKESERYIPQRSDSGAQSKSEKGRQ